MVAYFDFDLKYCPLQRPPDVFFVCLAMQARLTRAPLIFRWIQILKKYSTTDQRRYNDDSSK